MIYGKGSYSDLKSKCTVISTPETEPQDPALNAIQKALDEIDYLMEEYDSLHIEQCYINLKIALAMYAYFCDDFE